MKEARETEMSLLKGVTGLGEVDQQRALCTPIVSLRRLS